MATKSDDWSLGPDVRYKAADAFREFGEQRRSTGALCAALAGYRRILTNDWTRAGKPTYWPEAQNHLGIVLYNIGERESGTARLEEAVAAFRAALEVYTRAEIPTSWAGTQNHLGNALQTLGERESDTARLEEAVAAFRAARHVLAGLRGRARQPRGMHRQSHYPCGRAMSLRAVWQGPL
jgi:tetratricopeptide (TPR) repeat protein